MKLLTVEEMVAVEKEANASGLTYEMMMENAGRGLAEVVVEEFSELQDGGALGLVGSGNNGGDTLVALTYLAESGWRTAAYLLKERESGDPLMARFLDAGGVIISIEDDAGFSRLLSLVEDYAVVLDGVLGTGIKLPLRGQLAEALDAVRAALDEMPGRPLVVAVDCPSGVDANSGEAAPECIPADLTVTMAAVKTGLLLFPAYNLLGDLRLVGIGLPEGGETLKAWRSVQREVVTDRMAAEALPDRPLDSHKGTFGTALVIAGSSNLTGAVLLSGEAAYRIGTGLVTLAVPAPIHSALAGQLIEATWLLLPSEMGVISAKAADVVRDNLDRVKAILLGPGFGTEDATADFVSHLLAPKSEPARAKIGFQFKKEGQEEAEGSKELPPLVIDADGLKLLTRIPDWHTYLPAPAVLTPHPGEMSILTGLEISEIQSDRLDIARRFSEQWGHVVVLKGAFTVVAAPDGRTAVIPVATSALASAGTGDVLAGLIVGLRAQGVEAFEAAYTGAWIHAHAGLTAEQVIGNPVSVLAGDVLQSVPEVLNDLL